MLDDTDISSCSYNYVLRKLDVYCPVLRLCWLWIPFLFLLSHSRTMFCLATLRAFNFSSCGFSSLFVSPLHAQFHCFTAVSTEILYVHSLNLYKSLLSHNIPPKSRVMKPFYTLALKTHVLFCPPSVHYSVSQTPQIGLSPYEEATCVNSQNQKLYLTVKICYGLSYEQIIVGTLQAFKYQVASLSRQLSRSSFHILVFNTAKFLLQDEVKQMSIATSRHYIISSKDTAICLG